MYRRAVDRLPEMSVIVYSRSPSEDERAIYVPIEPTDPFTEAMRTALEIGAEIVFLEPDTARPPSYPRRLPRYLRRAAHGHQPYVDAYRVYPQPRTEEIDEHAAGDGLEAARRRSRAQASSSSSRSTCSTHCSTRWRFRRTHPRRAALHPTSN